MTRILSLCTYPVSVPRHGGQFRVDALHQMYRASGHQVRHLALYRADEYPEEPSSPWNVHFTWPFINELLKTGGRTDLNAPDFLLRESSKLSNVLNLIYDFKPEVIQLEHCWMWPLLKSLRSSSPDLAVARIIYSSQNVEYQLIGNSVNPDSPTVPAATVELVRRMEMDLVGCADLTIAVSEADLKVFQTTARRTVIARNGIWPRSAPTGLSFWNEHMSGRRFALFVGSAHPPNAAGFVQMLGPSLGYLAPNELVVVAGGVGNLLMTHPVFRANVGLNLARMMLVGVQDTGGMSVLIEKANLVIVPITVGGGTNIKMAEAMFNRKLVVCTEKSVRGYETFLDLPFVFVCKSPETFQTTLRSALRGELDDRLNISREQAERLKSLLWSSTLAGLDAEISRLKSDNLHQAYP